MKILALIIAIIGGFSLFDGVLSMNEISMVEGVLLFNLSVGCWIIGILNEKNIK